MPTARTILIVEDEPLIAMMLEDFLETLGHTVADTCETIEQALGRVADGGFDFAILDVNLRGEAVWPVAERLRDGGVPFVVATGGNVAPAPSAFDEVPVIHKPYTMERVSSVIETALASA